MSDTPADTVDLPASDARRRFEAEWRRVIDGPPRVEDFVASLPETQRDEARGELAALDSRFRKMLFARLSGETPPPSSPETPATPVDPAFAAETVNTTQGERIGGVTDHTVNESQGRRLDTPAAEGKARPKFPVIPGYMILSELGRGGMGVVYKARNLALERDEALKMIRAGADAEQEQLDRFYVEAQAVARLNHPAIVRVYGISSHDDMPYFSLEYVTGGTLSKKIAHKPLPAREAAAIAETVARGIAAAHAANVIHRDLKPANILLDDEGRPKVTDFGLARKLEGDVGRTRDGSVLGTPAYMAPEQARGENEDVGPAADVYALGATLYEMLTGRPPFQGADVLTTLDLVRNAEPVPPSVINPQVGKDLETICLKCLAKEPGKRYASAADAADDLLRYIEGKPIVARPVSSAERLWRWANRNPYIAALTTVVGVLLSVVAVVSTWSAVTVAGKNADLETANSEISAKNETLGELNAELVKERDEQKRQTALATKAGIQSANDSKAATFALRDIVSAVNNSFRGKPQLSVVRRQTINTVAAQVERLYGTIKENSTTDRTVAGTQALVGDIALEAGKPNIARDLYDRAFVILTELTRQAPNEPVMVANQASILCKRAEVALAVGDDAAALRLYDEALKLRLRWSGLLGGKNVNAVWTIAETHSHLGNVALRAGDPEAARRHFKDSEAGYDALEKLLPPKFDRRLAVRAERAALTQRLGTSAMQCGDLSGARRLFARALEERLAILKGVPRAAFARQAVALSRCDLGDLVLMWEGNPIAAADLYRQAVGEFAKLAAEAPDDSRPLGDLAFAEYRLAVALQQAGRALSGVAGAASTVAALATFDKVRRAVEPIHKLDPTDTRHAFQLLTALGRCGRRAEALSLADAMVKQSPKDARVLFAAACGRSLASAVARTLDEAKADREAAMALLERAVAAGWRDRVALERDPDLEAVRDEPRVRALASKMRAGG